MTSTGVPRTPDGNAVAERPSFVARARGRGASVVDPKLVVPYLAARADRERFVEAVGGDRVLVGAGRERLDRRSHRALSTPDNLVGQRLEPLEPEFVHELREPLATDGTARDLGVEVAEDHFGHAPVRPDGRDQCLLAPPGLVELLVLDLKPLL